MRLHPRYTFALPQLNGMWSVSLHPREPSRHSKAQRIAIWEFAPSNRHRVTLAQRITICEFAPSRSHRVTWVNGKRSVSLHPRDPIASPSRNWKSSSTFTDSSLSLWIRTHLHTPYQATPQCKQSEPTKRTQWTKKTNKLNEIYPESKEGNRTAITKKISE